MVFKAVGVRIFILMTKGFILQTLLMFVTKSCCTIFLSKMRCLYWSEYTRLWPCGHCFLSIYLQKERKWVQFGWGPWYTCTWFGLAYAFAVSAQNRLKLARHGVCSLYLIFLLCSGNGYWLNKGSITFTITWIPVCIE